MRAKVQLWAGEIALFALAFALVAAGWLSPLASTFADIAFATFPRHATGNIVVVQIDSRSLKELDTWPWPRKVHAKALDILHAAGASTIALDIDFSSRTVEQQDDVLSAAIRRANGSIVLPSFIQPSGTDGGMLAETSPLPTFASGALVGNANVFAPHGLVRSAATGVAGPDGSLRPSFAALVAQAGKVSPDVFDIDYSIDLKTIPHISFLDVYDANFDFSTLKGKRVIVGASAIELGDRVSVPVRGVISGVDLQALIAETVLQGRMLRNAGFVGQFAFVLLVLLMVRPSRRRWTFADLAMPSIAATWTVLLAAVLSFEYAGVILDPIPALLVVTGSVLWVGARELATLARAVLRERATSSMRRAMIELIVDESSDGIIVARDDGRVELCNEQAARFLSATRKSLVGRTIDHLIPTFDNLPANVEARGGTNRGCDLTLDGPDGPVMIEMTARRTRLVEVNADIAGQVSAIDVYTLRDVTALRKARAAEERARDELLAAERAKNNFVANMSHELRTPLNAIIGFSEILMNEVLGPVEQRAYVEHAGFVAKSGHYLLSIVNNVIDVARMDSDVLEVARSEHDFDDAISSGFANVKAHSFYAGQQLSVSIAPSAEVLNTDQKLLKHIVYNLLSNAVKFSPPSTEISVRAWQEGEDFLFEIGDQGSGIDPEILPRISKLFGHAESAFTRTHDGLGVGLYLVRRCLDKLGGSLTFETATNVGTRVRVVLPGAAMTRVATHAA